MESIWFNEELVVDLNEIEKLQESEARSHGQKIISKDEFDNLSKLTVVAENPIVKEISKDTLQNGVKGSIWILALRYILNSSGNLPFIYIKCETYLEPILDAPAIKRSENPNPTVIDFFPHIVYEDNRKSVDVSLKPALRLFDLEVSLAEIGAKLPDRFSPKIVGFPYGDDKRAIPSPYWEITPTNRVFKGELFFYMAVFKPNGVGIGIRSRIQAVVQYHFGPIPFGPMQKIWDSRKLFKIT